MIPSPSEATRPPDDPRPYGSEQGFGDRRRSAEMEIHSQDDGAALGGPLRLLRRLLCQDLRSVIQEELARSRLADEAEEEEHIDAHDLSSQLSSVDDYLEERAFEMEASATPTMPTQPPTLKTSEPSPMQPPKSGVIHDAGMPTRLVSRTSKAMMQEVQAVQPVHCLASEKPTSAEKLRLFHPCLGEGLFGRWADGWDWFMNDVKEPKRTGRLARFVDGRKFEYTFAFVILLNAVFMAYAMNHQASQPSAPISPFIRKVDMAFLGLYIVELSFKFIVHRQYFFFGDFGWKALDFSLVVYGIFDLIFEHMVGTSGGSSHWMRSIRLFKTVKVLRMLRVIKVLKELHLLMACILRSLRALMWSLVMMAVILYMFSLVFVQQATAYLGQDPDQQEELTIEGLSLAFGSVEYSIMTLFQTLFGGDDWAKFQMLLRAAGPLGEAMYIFFIAFANIALLNILTGIFVENALKLAQPNFFEKAAEHHRDLVEQAKVLEELCCEWDTDGNGLLSFKEFVDMVSHPKVRMYLDYLGLEVPSLEMFFGLLADDTGQVNVDTFVTACMRLRGDAKSIDMKQLSLEIRLGKLLRKDVKAIKKALTHGQNVMGWMQEGPKGYGPSSASSGIRRSSTESAVGRRTSLDLPSGGRDSSDGSGPRWLNGGPAPSETLVI